MSVQYDVLTVGAGLSGAVAARRFAESGKKILIIDNKEHPAGHCFDFKNEHGISVHKYGPHIFHTKEKLVWDYVNRFSEFEYYQHRVLSFAEGNYYPFPINCDTINRIFNLDLSVNEVGEFLREEAASSKYDRPPKNFRDAVVSQVGDRLYELFFRNYTRKQWERDPRELAADVAKRIPVRENRDGRYFSDQYQGIPKKGYTQLVRNILDHENIKLELMTDYFDVKDKIKADITVYTGKLDRYFDYRFGELEYRSLKLDFKTFDMERYQPAAVVNYPNDYDWTRIAEFKYFLNETSDKTTVLFEYPSKEGDPYYVVLSEDNIAMRQKYWTLAEAEENEQNVFFLGRLAEYRYLNMDQVVLNSLKRISIAL